MTATAAFEVPQVTQDDFAAFHSAHFSDGALEAFHSQFLHPSEADDYHAAELDTDFAHQEDDGLGYYEDGTKRTLTDEQIAIFRHSEIQALKKAAAIAATKRKSSVTEHRIDAATEETEDGEIADDVANTDTSAPQTSELSSSSKQRKKRGRNGNSRREPKPDLRKRTWDVVATGLESLDYDELESVPKTRVNPSQRRQISYDDD